MTGPAPLFLTVEIIRMPPRARGEADAHAFLSSGLSPREVKCSSNQATRKMHYFKSDIRDVPIRHPKDTMTKNICKAPGNTRISNAKDGDMNLKSPPGGSQKCHFATPGRRGERQHG